MSDKEKVKLEAAITVVKDNVLIGRWNSFYIDGEEYVIKIEKRNNYENN
jgi:hypothetical protein